MKILATTIFLVLFFSACQKNDTQSKIIKEPKWLNNPSSIVGDKLHAIGCSAIHYNGENAQKKLAIQRAIDEIALQVSTKVQTLTYRQRVIENKSQSSTINKESLHEVNNTSLKTRILKWHKNKDGDICALVVRD